MVDRVLSLEPLWRRVLGHRLRQRRLELGEKLADTSTRAGVSPQYLSEIERGLKEPSSEMIAAISGALGLSLLDLTVGLADDLRAFHDVAPSAGEYRPSAVSSLLMAA